MFAHRLHTDRPHQTAKWAEVAFGEILSQGLLTCLIAVYPLHSTDRLGVANSIIRVLIVSLPSKT